MAQWPVKIDAHHPAYLSSDILKSGGFLPAARKIN
jgi:hypothetical protein